MTTPCDECDRPAYDNGLCEDHAEAAWDAEQEANQQLAGINPYFEYVADQAENRKLK